jgi:hypothetical protein
MVLPVYLLILLPLVFAADLIWTEYLRLSIVTVGWYYFYWQYDGYDQNSERENTLQLKSVLIALALMFIVTQFDPRLNIDRDLTLYNRLFIGVTFVLVFVAFVGLLWSQVSPWHRLSLIDCIVIAIGCIVLGFIGISYFLFGKSFDWGTCIRSVMFLMLWFWSTRWLPFHKLSEKRLLVGIPIVFALVCLVGFMRIATTFYNYRSGELAQQSGDFETALEYFDAAATSGHDLHLNTLFDDAIFAKAEVLYLSGDKTSAAATLSLTDDFVFTISADSWDGAAGGMLYTNINCWKDLTLYEGNVNIKIFARGDVALGVWPRMRVMLGDRVLGEVDVDASEVRPYTFDVSVESARQRLDIAFTNDYFSPPENRNLWIEHAEVHYMDIAWK